MHESQLAAPAHGSIMVVLHSLGYHRHVEHVPDVGPLEEPLWHIPVAWQ